MKLLIKKTLHYLIYPLLLLTSLSSAFADNKDYTAAEIYTADSWLYGKYVFRMRVPTGSGILSNFFLWKPDSEISTVDWEEVDIEVFGKNGATTWQSNIITSADGWTTSEQVHEHTSSFSDDYHTFSIEWTSDYIAWFVDGEELRRTQGGQQNLLLNEASLRFNLWASDSEGWVGSFDDSILPVHMYINWLEYYSWDGETFDLDWRDDFNSFDSNRWSQADWTFDGNYVDFVPENANISNGYLVLSMTNSGEEGFVGTVPVDANDNTSTDNDSTDNDSTDNDSTDNTSTDNDSTDSTGKVSCTYTVTSEWNTGFVADIAITNNSSSVINDWAVTWEYSDNTIVGNIWNVLFSGSNPYTAESLSWNSTIAIGETFSFGFNGTKGNTDIEIPTITSDICD